MLIAGGAAIAISLSALSYYGLRLLENLESEKKYDVEPGGSIEVTQNFTEAGQGTYLAAFQAFAGGTPAITIRDPTDRIVVQKSADAPVVMEAFPVAQAGVYTLTLSNPSSEFELDATVVIDTPEAVLSRAGALSPATSVALGFLFVAGVAAAGAGVVVTITDKRRLGRMKQFGDTSDLV